MDVSPKCYVKIMLNQIHLIHPCHWFYWAILFASKIQFLKVNSIKAWIERHQVSHLDNPSSKFWSEIQLALSVDRSQVNTSWEWFFGAKFFASHCHLNLWSANAAKEIAPPPTCKEEDLSSKSHVAWWTADKLGRWNLGLPNFVEHLLPILVRWCRKKISI